MEKLSGGSYCIIPDQIEAGTYMAAVAAAGGQVLIKNVIPKHMDCISAKLMEMGVHIEEQDDTLLVRRSEPLQRANVKTQPYPGFLTDMQPQIAVVLSLAQGTSLVTEGVYGASRFKYLDELRRMGAHIQVDGRVAVIEGVEQLEGAPVHACDLRAGAALVIAGLAARGTTEISQIQFIERGYEDLVGKAPRGRRGHSDGGCARRSGRERGTDQLKRSEEIPASAAYGGRWFCLCDAHF